MDQEAAKEGTARSYADFPYMFSYECKVAFYLCCTAAWCGLVPWLVQNRGINATSERFLRLWHNQNQPRDDDGGVSGGARDVFCGQVALHPLSGVVLTLPSTPCCDRPMGRSPRLRNSATTAPGSQLCGVLGPGGHDFLIAAHEYQHSRLQWEATRATDSTLQHRRC